MKNLVDDLWQLSTEGFTASQSSKNTINFAYDSFSTSQFLNTLSQTHPTTGNAQMMYLTNSDGKVASTFSEVQDVLIVDTYAWGHKTKHAAKVLKKKSAPEGADFQQKQIINPYSIAIFLEG